MRTTIQITVGMALLVASFNFFLASDNPDTTNSFLFILIAIILAILSLMCWGDALNRAKKEENKARAEESKREQDKRDIKDLAQTLISEVKGLREDIRNRDKH